MVVLVMDWLSLRGDLMKKYCSRGSMKKARLGIAITCILATSFY